MINRHGYRVPGAGVINRHDMLVGCRAQIFISYRSMYLCVLCFSKKLVIKTLTRRILQSIVLVPGVTLEKRKRIHKSISCNTFQSSNVCVLVGGGSEHLQPEKDQSCEGGLSMKKPNPPHPSCGPVCCLHWSSAPMGMSWAAVPESSPRLL